MKNFLMSGVLYLVCIISVAITFAGATLIFILTLPWEYVKKLQVAFQGAITGLPQQLREKLKIFDIYGLRHNSHYLNENSTRIKVAMMPLEKQAEFADQVTVRAHPKKPGTIKGFPIIHSPFLDGQVNISALNTTAIGNMAWLALYHDHEETRHKCQNKLIEIREYFSQFSNTQNYD